MGQSELAKVLGHALTDKKFFEDLEKDPEKAVESLHVELTEAEWKVLKQDVLGKHYDKLKQFRDAVPIQYDKYN